jgi:hypothetical protein
MTVTLEEPTADQTIVNTYNKGMARSAQEVLEADTRYALCLLKLHSSVTPGDYATLKAAIEGVTGVQNISLVVDHVTRASVPAGKELKAVVEINLRLDNAPEV